MSRSIERQADQWSLPDRQASVDMPSQAELRDLLSGPKIQAGMLNTREASRHYAEDATPSGGAGHMVPMTPGTADSLITNHPDFQPSPPPQGGPQVFGPWSTGGGYPGFDRTKGIPDDAQISINQSNPGVLSHRKKASPRENPAGNLNLSPRRLDQQATQVQTKTLKPPKPKPIPDDLGQDKSLKVPNQMTAQHDPPVPPRGYLASFMRIAEDTPDTVADMLRDKKGQPVQAPTQPKPTGDNSAISQSGGGAGMMPGLAPGGAFVPPTADRATYNVQDMPGKTLADQRSMLENAGWGPATPDKIQGGPGSATQAPASDLSSMSAPAPKGGNESSTVTQTVSDTNPSTSGGGGGGDKGGGGSPGGGSPGGGWTERSIAPGSIDTSKDYTVQSGDTLSNIAQGAGLSGYEDLAKSNGISDPNKIDVGQTIHFSPSPGGPSTPVDQTPAVAATSDATPGTPVASGSPGADVGGPASAITGMPTPAERNARRYSDPPLPPPGTLKKFLAGSRRVADTDEERKRGPQYNPTNTNPALNNPAAPAPANPVGGQKSSPWFTPPSPSSSDAAPGPTPSEKAGEPIKPPTPTPAPSQPTSPNTPAPADATQGAPVKTNDLANASSPTTPGPSQPAGNPAQPPAPSGTDQPKSPDIGNGFSLSDAMGVIGGVGQGINTALSIGGSLLGALSGGGLGSLINGFGGLGMLGSTLGITAAQQQITASERLVKEHYV